MLLIGLFVFRREAAGGFIWLGQQMVEPAPVSEPAKTSPAPPVQERSHLRQEAKSPVPEAKSPRQRPSHLYRTPSRRKNRKPARRIRRRLQKTTTSRLQTIKSLWDEVAKGNVTSMLTLGNMYFTGHGVTKNCYQARRLFAAAARKREPGRQTKTGGTGLGAPVR